MLAIIAMYIKNIGLEIDLGIEIISVIVKKFDLCVSTYMSLIDDLESNNAIESYNKTISEKVAVKKSKLTAKINIIESSLEYIASPVDILKLCLSNKLYFERNFKKFKKRILLCDLTFKANRILIWKNALCSQESSNNFEQFKNANLFIDKNTEDVIKVDVLRTFSHDKTFDKDALFIVLRCGTLALQNGVGYCQGMNYIAGMFLYLNPNQNDAFDLYVSLIQKKLGILFENNFEQMKVFFYVLENVMLIFMNDLALDFKSKKIDSGYFCSSWFITLFSSAFQYTKKSYLVMAIMDLFIAQGFKAVLKAIVAILGFYKSRLIGKSFEETMEFMSDIVQQEIFKNTNFEKYCLAKKTDIRLMDLKYKFPHADEYEFVVNFKVICKKIKITNRLISKLQERYYSLGSKLNRL